MDTAKVAQRRSKNLFIAAQGFLENANAAIISEISNAEIDIGEELAALASDSKLADNIRIKHNCKTQGWNLSENGSFINGRYYSKHALERMAPINAEVRAVLEKRALKKYPLRYPLEVHKV